MDTYRVSFRVDLPEGATPAEVQAFIEFALGASCIFRPETDALKETDLKNCDVTEVEVRQI